MIIVMLNDGFFKKQINNMYVKCMVKMCHSLIEIRSVGLNLGLNAERA